MRPARWQRRLDMAGANRERTMQAAIATAFDAGRLAAMRGACRLVDQPAPVVRLHPRDLEAYRPALLRYARRAMRNTADAEDVVQATLLAALSAPESFGGRSSPRTWLHGILKHKIMDVFRRQAREPLRESQPEHELRDETEALFSADGHWREAPAAWGDPEAALVQREFHAVLDDCIASLPRTAARVFTMRELMELEVAEICEVLDITPNNCFVLLHRARMKLRVLLEQRWFAVQPRT
jgi:RNA polymerase sigma-70 factor (TIGR02943 family)